MNYNDTLKSLKPFIDKFQSDYERLLSLIRGKSLCFTIYYPAFKYYKDFGQMLQYQTSCEITINIFNDIIQRLVKKKGFELLELREIFTAKNDYSNSIEPSHTGGNKIASAISSWVNRDYSKDLK